MTKLQSPVPIRLEDPIRIASNIATHPSSSAEELKKTTPLVLENLLCIIHLLLSKSNWVILEKLSLMRRGYTLVSIWLQLIKPKCSQIKSPNKSIKDSYLKGFNF